MSGPLGSSQWMYSSGFYPYGIEQSLRFNDDDSAYLSRTPASAGNRKTWTWSGWVKRGNLSGNVFFGVSNGSTTQFYIQFSGGNALGVDDWNGSIQLRRVTNAVFRDPSAWYHVVVALDTTQATASDRVKIYVNGEEITSFSLSTDPGLNYDGAVNTAAPHALGREEFADTSYFDGYMAEVNFIDGTALDPTSFGQFKSGVWIPKKYTGSYGTNGFYLSFADSAAIGDDLSGNGNDWTPSGLASTDVLLDSPTNNYATWNPLTASNASISFHEANLKVEMNAAYPGGVMGSFGVNEGKFYWEVLMGGTGNSANGYNAGVATPSWANRNTDAGTDALAYTHLVDSRLKFEDNSTDTINGVSFTVGDTIGIALNCDDNEISYYKNGILIGSARTLEAGQVWIPYCKASTSVADQHYTANFGQSPFAYTPPAGFLALNTANLPDPAIDPAQDDVPADYFNTVLYTGDGTTPRSITGLGFEPSLTWYKSRSAAYFHHVFDAVRGANKQLHTNATSAETTQTQALISFDADGFTLGSNGGGNDSGQTFVAWNWKAAGAGVANTDGTISSTVSANQKAGFSIVSYTGTQGDGATVGHGLGAAPKMVIIKQRNGSPLYNWNTYHASIGNTQFVALNTTAAVVTGALFNNTSPTSSVFSLGSAASNWNDINDEIGVNYIAYCFAEVEGYSKFGSYTGNGSADGVFCWNGFKPALIMVKRTDTTSNWTILDDAREGYNVDNDPLYPNLSNAEGTTDLADLLSNGFKLRTTDASVNASGGTYIYAAFASMPFKFSGGR